jgi:hypothetical protein
MANAKGLLSKAKDVAQKVRKHEATPWALGGAATLGGGLGLKRVSEDYYMKGHRLMNERAVYQGKPIKSIDVMKMTREILPEKVMAAINPNTAGGFTQRVKEHYQTFEDDPKKALGKMMGEVYVHGVAASDPVQWDAHKVYSNSRSQALRSLINNNPEGNFTFDDYAQEILKNMSQYRRDLTPHEKRILLNGIRNTERKILHADPQGHISEMQNLSAAVRSGDRETADAILEQNNARFFQSRPKGHLHEDMFDDIHNRDFDAVTGLATVDASRMFRDAVDRGYSKLYPGAHAIQGAGHVANLVTAGGVGLLAKPVLGKGKAGLLAGALGAGLTGAKLIKDNTPIDMSKYPEPEEVTAKPDKPGQAAHKVPLPAITLKAPASGL